MRKIDVLIWGIKHIAGNHHFSGDFYTDYETGDTIVYTATNVPTTADVRMLAEDLGVSQCCTVVGFTVNITVSKHWVDTIGQEEYVPGLELWRRYTANVGDHLGYMCEEYDPFYERSGSLYLHVDDLQAAKDVCIKECQRTRNGNLYSVWEVGMEKNTEVYCCQYSSERGDVMDVKSRNCSAMRR